MRTLALRTLSCALLSIAAVPALAIDQDILLSANLEPSCTLNGSTAPQAVSGEISFTDGQITSAPLVFELPIACNIQASIMIGTLNAGLRTANNTPFSNNRIDYVASVGGGIYVPFFLDCEPALLTYDDRRRKLTPPPISPLLRYAPQLRAWRRRSSCCRGVSIARR